MRIQPQHHVQQPIPPHAVQHQRKGREVVVGLVDYNSLESGKPLKKHFRKEAHWQVNSLSRKEGRDSFSHS